MLCCGAFVLLGWSLRGNFDAQPAPAARDANLPAAPDPNVVPVERMAFAADFAVPASPASPARLLAAQANVTPESVALGRDAGLASQASAANLSKGSVKGGVLHADR